MRFREEKTKKNIISVTYQYFNVVLMMPEPFALKVVALFLHALCLADTRGAGICANYWSPTVPQIRSMVFAYKMIKSVVSIYSTHIK